MFPTANVTLAPGLSTPVVKEFTASFDAAAGSRGSLSGTYIFRRTGNLIEDYASLANGVTHVVRGGNDFGTFTNVLFANSDVATRRYQGLQFEGLYRVRRNWSINGHYTVMLQDEGNARIHEAYPAPTYERLAAVKRRYDPDNRFNRNQNILPA